MSEDKKSFTVKDRRHFTSDGAAREADAPAETAAPSPTPVPGAEGASPTVPPAQAAPASSDEAEPAQVEGSRFPSDFMGLLVTLGTQGSMLLAGVVPGQERPGPPDLDGARDVISLLESLQAKSEGHRTADEDRLLGGILYELRMAYVALRKDARA
jgi:hypothetical protein